MTHVDVRTVWTRGVLIPFWVLQMLVVLIQLAVDGILLAALVALKSNGLSGSCQDANGNIYDCSTAVNVATAVTAIGMIIAIVFFILLIAQIVQYTRSALTPRSYFSQQLFMIIVWTIALVLGIVALVQNQGGLLQLVIYIICWLLFLGTFIYSCVILKRMRSGYYGSTNNPATQHNSYNMNKQYNTQYNNGIPADQLQPHHV